MSRVVASVLLSAQEERRLNRLARGRPYGSTLLRLAERDVEKHGAEPMTVAPSAAQAVARKLSVAIPPGLMDAVDGRRGTTSYGAYLRALLGVRPATDGEPLPAHGEVVVRAARALQGGRLGELLSGDGPVDEVVALVPDLTELTDAWQETIWHGMSAGEAGWLVLGLSEPHGPSTLVDRPEGERAFAILRELFRADSEPSARIVLHPSFVFLRHRRGRRIGEARWVECDENEKDCVVVVVRVETQAFLAR